MFEVDIETLKKKIEVLEKMISEITKQIQENKDKERTVKKLRNNREDFKYSKKYLKFFPMICGLGSIFCCSVFCIASPSVWIPMLPFMLGICATVSSIFVGYSIAMYFFNKFEYKRIATDENLELESIIDSILAESAILQQRLEKSNVKLTNYKELVEYLSEYNDKYSLLEAIQREDEIDIENLFNEYLAEKVDYSKVHFDNDTLPDEIHLKKLNK